MLFVSTPPVGLPDVCCCSLLLQYRQGCMIFFFLPAGTVSFPQFRVGLTGVLWTLQIWQAHCDWFDLDFKKTPCPRLPLQFKIPKRPFSVTASPFSPLPQHPPDPSNTTTATDELVTKDSKGKRQKSFSVPSALLPGTLPEISKPPRHRKKKNEEKNESVAESASKQAGSRASRPGSNQPMPPPVRVCLAPALVKIRNRFCTSPSPYLTLTIKTLLARRRTPT